MASTWAFQSNSGSEIHSQLHKSHVAKPEDPDLDDSTPAEGAHTKPHHLSSQGLGPYLSDLGHEQMAALSSDAHLVALDTTSSLAEPASHIADPASANAEVYQPDHQFLLDELDHDLFTRQSHAGGRHNDENHPHTHNRRQELDHGRLHGPAHASDLLSSDFHLDGMEFIAPEDLGSDSRAYPPSAFPQNTPALAARRCNGISQPQMAINFQSPILPGQNAKSFNQEHLLQKQMQQRSRHGTPMMAQQKSGLSSHTQPTHEANFTPLASPAVTPSDSQPIYNVSVQSAAPADFEPLTSPALKAQNQGSGRRRSSSTFTGDEYSTGNAKRRTPHSTPNLQAVSSKLKRSPSLRKTSQSFEPKQEGVQETSRTASSETTPMLPPQGKRPVIDSSSMYNQSTNGSSSSNNFGPSTLMGFTMNRLAQQQGEMSENVGSLESVKFSQREGHNLRGNDTMLGNTVSSSSDTSPVIDAQGGEQTDYGSGKRNGSIKKTSHKIAEQGRRNRMNHAVHELSRLIPSAYREKVAVPSKATTVELAATYIRHLVAEIEHLKGQTK